MKEITLLSDIHNNYGSFSNFIETNKKEKTICLGDIIGYNDNFDPNLSIEALSENCIESIAGNWDRMVNMPRAPSMKYAGNESYEQRMLKTQIKYGGTVPNNKYYNGLTMNALKKIITEVSLENKIFLESLPDTLSFSEIYHFVHGGFHESQLKNGLKSSELFEVKQFNYNAFIAEKNSASQLIPGKIIIHGHTHKASVFYEGKYFEISKGSDANFEIINTKGAVISLPSLGRKVKEPDFNGYALMKISNNKTNLEFIEI